MILRVGDEIVNKKIKSIVFAALISITALSLAGCGGQSKDMMNTSNMTQYMKGNPTEMLASPW